MFVKTTSVTVVEMLDESGRKVVEAVVNITYLLGNSADLIQTFLGQLEGKYRWRQIEFSRN